MLSLGMQGVVERIYVAAGSGDPMQELDGVEVLLGSGLRGDRYLSRTGYWSGVDECQVTFIEGEILDRIVEETGLKVWAGEHRRNIVTRGIRLAQLLGKRFAIGSALFEYDRPRPPCSHIQSRSAPGQAKALFGQRGGIGARVMKSGLIRGSNPVQVVSES
jgi:MOSC domain-containing protein YiiM